MSSCSQTFKALSDETRQKILGFLKNGPLSVNEIVARTELAQPTVSHHLNLLKQAGILVTKRRGKQTYYSLCCGSETLQCCAGIFDLLGVRMTDSTRGKKSR
jgi:DNA-binding transcriptional ArsR family regulator